MRMIPPAACSWCSALIASCLADTIAFRDAAENMGAQPRKPNTADKAKIFQVV